MIKLFTILNIIITVLMMIFIYTLMQTKISIDMNNYPEIFKNNYYFISILVILIVLIFIKLIIRPLYKLLIKQFSRTNSFILTLIIIYATFGLNSYMYHNSPIYFKINPIKILNKKEFCYKQINDLINTDNIVRKNMTFPKYRNLLIKCTNEL